MAQAAERRRGEVISFYDTRGYGFIKPEDGGEEVFVHHSSIQSNGYRTLIKGSIVEFACDVSEDNKFKAVDVTGPNGSLIHPPRRSGGECYNCGAHGHIARDCESRRVDEGGAGDGGGCYNCGEHGHLARNCSEKNDSRGSGGCYNCGKSGHFARECPRGGGGGGGGGRRIECYTCGGFGHFARECPSAGGRRYGGGGGGGGGGGDECFNCGNQGHFARNCPEVSVRK